MIGNTPDPSASRTAGATRPRRLAALAALAALQSLTGSPALAQQAGGGESAETIDTVFVIGQRRAYQGLFESREVPGVVQEIDLERMREVGALNLNDALDLSAAVARQNNFGGLWNSFAIRGFAGDENLPSGFLVNGFNAGRGFGGPRDLVGIERVEVLKGPKAALFGRGEPGGAVNLVTKRPEFEQSGEFWFTAGSWRQLRLEGDAQTTLGRDDNIGLRLVGFSEDSESFRKTVETSRRGFYPSLAWRVNGDTRVTYELEFTSQEIPFDRGVVALNGELGFMPIETFVGEPGDGPIETEVLGHQIEAQHSFSDNWSVLAGLGLRDTSFAGNAAEPNFGGRQSIGIDGRSLSRFQRSRDFDTEYFVLRAELAGEFDTGSMRHRLLLGWDRDRFENDQVILRYRPPWFGGANGDLDALDPSLYRLLDVLNPVYGLHPAPPLGPNWNRFEEQEAWGVYIQDQIDVSDKLQIRIGGRFDDFSQEFTNRRNNPPTVSGQSDSRFSPQIGAVYLANAGVSLFAAYGEGFRQLTGADYAGNPFEPNKSQSAEAGIKFDLGEYYDNVSGSATIAVFSLDQSNILVYDDRPEASGGFNLRAAGEAASDGIEFDLEALLPGDVSLWFSYAYVDAEYANDSADPNFTYEIKAGDPLINVPKHQLNLQAGKGFRFGGGSGDVGGRIGGGFLTVGERLGMTATDFHLPGYTAARIFGEVEIFAGTTLRLDVDNVFDEEFYTNSWADVWVEPGAPLRYRLTAAVAF